MREAILVRASWIESMFSILGHGKSGMIRIRKDFSKVDEDSIFDGAQLNLATDQDFHRSHWFTITSDYEIEVTEICIYVEREAVRRDPSRYVYTDRRNLSELGVNTR